LTIWGDVNRGMLVTHDISLGIVQGRLMQSPKGLLQWFPQDNWETEFFLAACLGINYIELIAERQHNSFNPLWTDIGIAKIKELVEVNRLSTYSLCNDYIVDHNLAGDPKVLDQNFNLIERAALIGCDKFILPLFERSELTLSNVSDYIFQLRKIADKALEVGVSLCLETTLNSTDLIKTLDCINRPEIGVVFDTGNQVAFGHDLAAEIRQLDGRICHVHIKDKNIINENVILGTGIVNFLNIFNALAAINYQGSYTLETCRGKNPISTAKFNIEFVKFFYLEAFRN